MSAGVGEVDEEAPLLQSSYPKKTGRVKSQDADNVTAFIIFCLVISMIICFVFSGSLSPKGFSTPTVQLGSFSADPFSVDVSATNPKITAHCNITFFFTNPYGSDWLIYRKLDAEVFTRMRFLEARSSTLLCSSQRRPSWCRSSWLLLPRLSATR